MKPRTCLLPFLLFALLLAICTDVANASPLAYITNACSGTVTVVDTATDAVLGSPISVGNSPLAVVVNPTGTRVYVTNAGDATVSVIDATSSPPAAIATINVGPEPFAIAINPAGTRVYVSNNGAGTNNTVSVIDTGSNAVIATITAGFGPAGLAVNPAGTRLYVVNNPASTLSVIDTSNNSVITTVSLSGSNAASGVVVNPAGTRVYVAGPDAGQIHVLDTSSNTVIAEISVPGKVSVLALTPDATRLYAVISFGADTVAVIDTASNSVVATIPISGAASVAVTPDGKRAYVTSSPNSVFAIDTTSNTIVDTISVACPLSWGPGFISSEFLLPVAELTPSDLIFPSAGSTLPVTVTNSGTAPLNITTPPAFTGFNSFDFSVASGTTCTNGTVVAPGNSCVINITFMPLTTSAESATLSVFDNAIGSPQMVPLSGGATVASILPNPVLGSAGTQTVTVTGIGFVAGQVLNYRSIKSTGTKGTVTPVIVTPDVLTASIPFTDATATWEIQVANPGEPTCGQQGTPFCYSFEVLGSQYPYVNDYPFQNAPYCPIATPPPQCSSDTLDPYGFFYRECTSYAAWRMNRNAGTIDPKHPYFFNAMDNKHWGIASNWSLNASRLGYAVGPTPQAGDIAQWADGQCGTPCKGGHVAYVEQVNQDGSIVVSEYNYPENKAVNHQFNVRPIAVGSRFYPPNFIHILYITVSTDLLNFGSQAVNTSSSLPVTVTNPGSSAVAVAGISISGSNRPDFTQTNTCGSSIPAGGSCEITVTFTPKKIGMRSAVVIVNDTDGPPIRQIISLIGNGT